MASYLKASFDETEKDEVLKKTIDDSGRKKNTSSTNQKKKTKKSIWPNRPKTSPGKGSIEY